MILLERGDYMKRNGQDYLFLLSTIIIGILICLSPNIVTGSPYDTSKVMGNLLVAEFTVRVLAIAIGLIIVYDGIKSFFKKQNER